MKTKNLVNGTYYALPERKEQDTIVELTPKEFFHLAKAIEHRYKEMKKAKLRGGYFWHPYPGLSIFVRDKK